MAKRSKPPFALAILGVLLSLLVPGLASAGTISAGISFTENGTEGHADHKSRMIGWQFTVGADPLLVTELGFQDFGLNGLSASHQVGIWRLSDEVLIDSVVVPSGTSGALDGFFRYAPLDSPPTLTPGTTYVISGFDNGYDPSVGDVEISGYPNMDVAGFSVDPAITIGDEGTAHGPFQGSFGFPTSLVVPDARAAIMGPNLRFAAVPEPSSFVIIVGLGLIGIAGYGWRRKRKLTA